MIKNVCVATLVFTSGAVFAAELGSEDYYCVSGGVNKPSSTLQTSIYEKGKNKAQIVIDGRGIVIADVRRRGPKKWEISKEGRILFVFEHLDAVIHSKYGFPFNFKLTRNGNEYLCGIDAEGL